MFLNNFITIFKSKAWWMGFALGFLLVLIPTYYFYNKELIIWNFGYNYYLMDLFFSIGNMVLFWIFLWATFYKFREFDFKNSSGGVVWWFLSILVSWCPACSISLATYLGLSSFILLLPFGWIELKILWFIILLFVNINVIRKLNICSINIRDVK